VTQLALGAGGSAFAPSPREDALAKPASSSRLSGSSRNGRKEADLLGDFAAGADEIREELLVHVERAFVLGPIPHVVALRQHPPDFGTQADRVWQHLKHDLAFRWPEPAMPEGRQGEGVSGAVGEIEPAVQ